MRKEREIIIKFINTNVISNKRIAEFFARKYTEEEKDVQNKKS